MKTLKIFGPPGTGKTQTLLELFERELRRTRPERIAFLTFTRAARKEALLRSGRAEDELPFLRTVHAICYRQVGCTQDQLVKARSLRQFGTRLGIELTGATKDPWAGEDEGGWLKPTAGDRLLQLNHLGRHRREKLRDVLRFADQELDYFYARWFTRAYRDWKTADGLLDFTDLLTDYLEHGEPLDIDVLFVDEAQDLSKLQWEVVQKLGASASRTYVAGDDDQAIFTWAGADAHRFLGLPATEERVLDRSHRLPRAIHRVATSITARIKKRKEKEFLAREADGEFSAAGLLSPELLGHGETFLLFRNHYRGRQLAKQLEELSWPYRGSESPLADDQVLAALEGFHRAVASEPISPFQARSLAGYAAPAWLQPRLKERSRRDRSLLSVDDIFLRRPSIEDWHEVLVRLPGKEYVSRCVAFHGWPRTLDPSTTLMSIHQSKGRQADTVILDLGLARRTYDAWLEDPEDEHRVWYVGATRARERLLTLAPDSEWSYPL